MVQRLPRRLGHAVRPLAWRVSQPPEFLPPLVVQCIKIAVGCGIAWFLGPYLDLPRPYNAVLAVIILMQGNAYGSLLNSLQFLIGVGAGLLLGIGASRIPIDAPLMAGIMFVCLLAGGLIKINSQGFNNQIAVSALLVLASGEPSNLGRLWETLLGGAVGVAVAALLWPPNPVRGLRGRARELGTQICDDLSATIEAVAHPSGDTSRRGTNRRQVREHSDAADAAVAEIGPAREALRWNPWHFRRGHDLGRIEDRLRLIAHLYLSVRALARQAEGMAAASGPEMAEALDDAGRLCVDAIQTRLTGRDAGDLVTSGRDAVEELVRRSPPEQHALAAAAALDSVLGDVESWSWESPDSEQRRLRIMTRILRRLGRQRLATLPVAHRAQVEFQEELGQARAGELTDQLHRRPARPPVLEDVVAAAGVEREEDRGERQIPLSKIRGSERATRDFDASFTPLRGRVRDSWVHVFQEMEQHGSVEPVEVYAVGDSYYVRHGHTRVSVARHLGWVTIAAHVIDVETRAPIDQVNPEKLLQASEYAEFLRITELDHSRPQARLACSELGRFDLILDHIQGHRWFLGEQGREVDVREAAASWYDTVYRPTMEAASRLGLGGRLPDWTETDIYLALTQVWFELDQEGRQSGPDEAAAALVEDAEPAQHLPDGVRPGPQKPRRRVRPPA